MTPAYGPAIAMIAAQNEAGGLRGKDDVGYRIVLGAAPADIEPGDLVLVPTAAGDPPDEFLVHERVPGHEDRWNTPHPRFRDGVTGKLFSVHQTDPIVLLRRSTRDGRPGRQPGT